MRGAVGCYQSVGAEVGVVYNTHEAHITAKCPYIAVVPVLDGEGLVHPVPDEAALQLVVFINQIPVILEVSHAVAHGMSIFAHNHRTLVALVDMAAKRPYTCIHGTVDVTLCIIAAAFVLHGACCVCLFCIVIECLEVFAIARFISHRPCDDGGAVTVAGYHAAHALHERQFPIGIVGEGFVFVEHHSMAFDVGFVHHI